MSGPRVTDLPEGYTAGQKPGRAEAHSHDLSYLTTVTPREGTMKKTSLRKWLCAGLLPLLLLGSGPAFAKEKFKIAVV